jgi:hypothetical protein
MDVVPFILWAVFPSPVGEAPDVVLQRFDDQGACEYAAERLARVDALSRAEILCLPLTEAGVMDAVVAEAQKEAAAAAAEAAFYEAAREAEAAMIARSAERAARQAEEEAITAAAAALATAELLEADREAEAAAAAEAEAAGD